MEFKRYAIYPKDVEIITGRSNRHARRILIAIRHKLGKQKHQIVSIHELCDHLGLDVMAITKLLQP